MSARFFRLAVKAPAGNANEALIFPSTAARLNPNINNLVNASFGSITFNGATAGGYTITGNAITFSGSGAVLSNSGLDSLTVNFRDSTSEVPGTGRSI